MKIRRIKRYRTIIIDPPWPERGGGKIVRGAQRHYPLMTVAEIRDLPIDRWADYACHLYLWATNNYLEDAFNIMRHWRFRYITLITWHKDKTGLGQYFRGNTEHTLFGVRGRLPYRYLPDGKRAQGKTGYDAPRGRHSQKPSQIHEWAEVVSHGPRIELFARSRREGWDAWGNEVNHLSAHTPR